MNYRRNAAAYEKLLAVLIIVVAVALLASCSANKSSPAAAAGSPSLSPASPPVFTTPLSDVVLSLSLDPQNVKTGDSVAVNILIEARSTYRGAQWSLNFDPAVMQCNSVKEGTFFKDWAAANSGDTIIYPDPVIDNRKGNISDMGIAAMAPVEGGASGKGILCTYQFTALTDSVTVPTIANASVADNTGKMLKATVKTRE